MKRMEFICNPTNDQIDHFDSTKTPIFDYLLPHYSRLTHLFVSSTEVSYNLFRFLPRTLVELEIQAFNHVGTFVFSPVILEALSSPAVRLESLRSFKLHDLAEAWEDEHIDAIERACYSRGIDFSFEVPEVDLMDEDEDW